MGQKQILSITPKKVYRKGTAYFPGSESYSQTRKISFLFPRSYRKNTPSKMNRIRLSSISHAGELPSRFKKEGVHILTNFYRAASLRLGNAFALTGI